MGYEQYDLGPIDLQYGGRLSSAFLAFKTHGRLNEARDNVVVFPTWCAGTHKQTEWIIGPHWALDPGKYFIVVIDMFGNGMSSSPSNTPAPFDRARFPRFSILDNVVQMRRMLSEHFGIERIHLMIGRSMGAQVAFQWASHFPDEVERMLALAGSARTAPHNYAFLACLKMALTSPPEWNGGDYDTVPEESLRRFLLTTDAWGFSQTWFREGHHLSGPFETTEAYLRRDPPPGMCDPNDLLAQIATWEVADISDNNRYGKDFKAALGAITAKSCVMPVKTDLYFPPEDSEIEVAAMPNAELRVMPSIWGHRGGSPGTDPVDIAFLDAAIADLLKQDIPVSQ